MVGIGIMRKVLILGCGYVGSALARELKDKGFGVIAVTRNEERLRLLKGSGVEARQARVDSEDWHGIADTDVDLVVNCVSSAGGGLEGYRQSYLEGNRSLGKWMRRRNFSGKAIYTSSVSVYPNSGGGWLLEADAAPDNERGEVIFESERIFMDTEASARLAVLRLGGIYGPGRTIFAQRIAEVQGSLPGWGDYFLNLARVEDIVSAIIELGLESVDLEGIFNVVDDCPALKADIVSWVANRIGRVAPGFSGEKEDQGSRRGSGKPANRRISNARLKERTGWRPKFPSFREGYADLLNGVDEASR